MAPPHPATRSSGRWWPRLLARVAAGLLALAAVVVLALHVPAVQDAVLARIAGSLRSQAGIELRAESLRYNLLTLSVTLRQVSMAAARTPDTPFIVAEAATLRFGARILVGTLDIVHVAIRSPRIVVNAPPESNLPEPGDSNNNGEGPALKIPALAVENLGIAITAPGRRLELRDARIDITPAPNGVAHGRIDVRGGMTLALGSAAQTFERAAAQFSVDGTQVSIDSIDLAGDSSTLQAHGSIDMSPDRSRIDLHVTGSTNLASWDALIPDIGGTVELSAHLTGSLADPAITVDATGRQLAWSSYSAASAALSASWRDGSLSLQRFEAELAGGQVRAAGTLQPRESALEGRIQAQWQDVKVAQLLGAERSSRQPDITTTGQGEIEWPSNSQRPGLMRVTARAQAVAAGEQIAADVQATSAGDAWNIEVATRGAAWSADGNARITLASDAWGQSPVDGQIVLRAIHAGRTLASLRSFGVPIGQLDPRTVGGSARAEAALAGTLGGLIVEGQIKDTSVQLRPWPQVHVGGRFVLDLNRRASTGAVEFSSFIDPASPAPLAVSGRLKGTASWSGSLAAPVAHATLRGSNVAVAELELGSVELEARVARTGIEVAHATIEQVDGGTLEANGHYRFDTKVAALEANGRKLSGRWGVTAVRQLSLAASLRGQIDRLDGNAFLTVGNVDLNGAAFGALRGDLSFERGAGRLHLEAPTGKALLDARLESDQPRSFSGQGQIDVDVARLAAAAGFGSSAATDFSGSLSSNLDFRGSLREPKNASATLQAALSGASAYGIPVRTAEPVRVKLIEQRVTLDRTTLTVGDIDIHAAASAGISDGLAVATVDLDGTLASLSSVFTHLAPDDPWSATGDLIGALELRRAHSGLSLTGTLGATQLSVRKGESVLVHDAGVGVDFTGPRSLLRDLTVKTRAGDAALTADVPLAWANPWLPDGWRFNGEHAAAPATLTGKANVAWRAARGEDDRSTTDATLTADLEARLQAQRPTLDAVEGEIHIERGRISARAEEFVQTEPTTLKVQAGAVAIDRLHWRGAGNEISTQGVLGLDKQVASDLRIELRSDLALIDAIAHQGLSGQLAANVTVKGPRDRLNVAADAEVKDASWLLPQARLYLSGWSGRIVLTDNALTIEELAGRANGGPVRIDGRVGFTDSASPATLTLTAQDVVLDVPEGLHSQLAAALTWQSAGKEPRVAGTVTVTANRYTEPITHVLELVDTMAPSSFADSSESSLPAWLNATRLDVQVVVTDPLIIDNSIGSIELVPDLRLVGTVEAPALSGRVAALDGGRIRIGGRQYNLRESSVRFSPTEGLIPTLDAVGETKIGDYDVTLRITGTANRIETSYRSSPPLSERDLKSLVVTGQTESGARADLNSGRGQGSDDFAVTAASTDILGFAGKFVGLDSVSLGTADLDLVSKNLDSAQHVTVSKSLGRKLQLIVSDNLETGALTWVIAWKPVTSYELRLASIEDTEHTIEFRREHLFGPGGTTRTAAATQTSTPRRTVTGVTFTGAPGFDEEELRGQLKMLPGEAFDVRRWTEDRLRLQELYDKRGFRRARITPTRDEATGDAGTRAVTLHYHIVRGPQTIIEFTGDRLPRKTRAAMNEVWRGVPVTAIVVQGMSRVVQHQLAERGYFQSNITVELVSDTPELVQARVHVEQGPRTRERRIDWLGNSAVSDADLDAIAAEQTEATSVWVAPATVVRAIRARYARLGYLATKVNVGAPSFTGPAATLPIEIAEGQRSTIGKVELAGVDPSRHAAVLTALELPAGSALGSQSVPDARLRLTRYYAGLGYHDAKIDYSIATPRGSGALVRMNVREGPMKVIEAVRVTGAESTAQSLVDDSLALKPGDVAGQDAVDATQRKLYDIGSFRQVEVELEPTGAVSADGRQSVVALVRAEEPKRYQLRYGLQVSNGSEFGDVGDDVNSFGFTADLRDRNFLGRAMEASTGVEWEPDLQAVTALLATPRTLGRPIRTNIYARARYERDGVGNGFDLSKKERDLTIEQRWQIRPKIELTWGYTYGYDEFLLEGNGNVFDSSGYLAGPTASVVVDHRDNPFDAKRGWYHSFNLQLGIPALGSDFGYYRAMLRQTQLWSLGPTTLAASARLGAIEGYSGVPPLSVVDILFTAGGTNSVRGYSEDALSALTVADVDLGGPELLVLNTELRFPIYGLVSGVAFVDAGNTFLDFNDISLDELAVGAGLGIRVRTPLAPLRLDFGYPLSTGFGEREVHIHFSIGQMF